MNFAKKILASSVAASVLAVSAVVPAAHAELSGSVGIASSYLWRGYDLGAGDAAVSGDLSYSAGGAYGGVWVSSGDAALGTEYDLYIGYGHAFGSFSIDASLWSYNYPQTNAGSTFDGDTASDFVLSLGLGPVALGIFTPVGEGSGGDYMYYTLGTSFGKFSATLGMHDSEEESPTHVNIDYAYNDNLTFTFSQFISDEPEDDQLKVVVSYSIPIGE